MLEAFLIFQIKALALQANKRLGLIAQSVEIDVHISKPQQICVECISGIDIIRDGCLPGRTMRKRTKDKSDKLLCVIGKKNAAQNSRDAIRGIDSKHYRVASSNISKALLWYCNFDAFVAC